MRNRFQALGRSRHTLDGFVESIPGTGPLVASGERQLWNRFQVLGHHGRLRRAGGTQGWAGGSCDPFP